MKMYYYWTWKVWEDILHAAQSAGTEVMVKVDQSEERGQSNCSLQQNAQIG